MSFVCNMFLGQNISWYSPTVGSLSKTSNGQIPWVDNIRNKSCVFIWETCLWTQGQVHVLDFFWKSTSSCSELQLISSTVSLRDTDYVWLPTGTCLFVHRYRGCWSQCQEEKVPLETRHCPCHDWASPLPGPSSSREGETECPLVLHVITDDIFLTSHHLQWRHQVHICFSLLQFPSVLGDWAASVASTDDVFIPKSIQHYITLIWDYQISP